MRILCAVGIRRGTELVRRVAEVARPGDELVLVHVVDTGPRYHVNHLEGTLRSHHEHKEELDSAEQDAGQALLNEAAEEAGRAGLAVAIRLEHGRPEQVVTALAREEADPPLVGGLEIVG